MSRPTFPRHSTSAADDFRKRSKSRPRRGLRPARARSRVLRRRVSAAPHWAGVRAMAIRATVFQIRRGVSSQGISEKSLPLALRNP